MLDINNVILLTDKVKSKAVANNQLATARVASKLVQNLKHSALDLTNLKHI